MEVSPHPGSPQSAVSVRGSRAVESGRLRAHSRENRPREAQESVRDSGLMFAGKGAGLYGSQGMSWINPNSLFQVRAKLRGWRKAKGRSSPIPWPSLSPRTAQTDGAGPAPGCPASLRGTGSAPAPQRWLPAAVREAGQRQHPFPIFQILSLPTQSDSLDQGQAPRHTAQCLSPGGLGPQLPAHPGSPSPELKGQQRQKVGGGKPLPTRSLSPQRCLGARRDDAGAQPCPRLSLSGPLKPPRLEPKGQSTVITLTSDPSALAAGIFPTDV